MRGERSATRPGSPSMDRLDHVLRVLGYVSIAIGEFAALLLPSLAGYEKPIAILTLASLAAFNSAGCGSAALPGKYGRSSKCGAFLTVVVAAMVFAPHIPPIGRRRRTRAIALRSGHRAPVRHDHLRRMAERKCTFRGGPRPGVQPSAVDDRRTARVIVVYLLVNVALLAVLPIGTSRARRFRPRCGADPLGGRGREIINDPVDRLAAADAQRDPDDRDAHSVRDGTRWTAVAARGIVTAGGTRPSPCWRHCRGARARRHRHVSAARGRRLVLSRPNYVVCCVALVRCDDRSGPRAAVSAVGLPWSVALVLAGAVVFLVGAAAGDTINAAGAVALLVLA